MTSAGPAGRAATGDLAPRGVSDPAAGSATADAAHLARAIDLATANVGDGGGPFGAVIVGPEGTVIAEGQNRVTRDLDPTAHAEVVAIRAACQVVGSFALDGCTLYTSCEPCPLCLAAALWSRVDRVVFAADRYDAARGGFDDLAFYELFARDRSEWELRVDTVRPSHAAQPFDTWLTAAARTAY
ncbi:nucleoside deaminase [Frondihabitans australicus]|uniref:Guanine deaminase n=1 Tax=Frondihabitans australicus TaxID=386892 RepID=A0A495IJ67_9MICO|nr:nucleoside deaminase [Frondihabitans australicus]RKR76017.1 guanine deaminase [Frondihabitans australicus]